MDFHANISNTIQITQRQDGTIGYTLTLVIVDASNEELQTLLSNINETNNTVVLSLHTEKTKEQ